MTNKKLKELLMAHSEVVEEIKTVALPIYEKRNELMRQIVPAFIEKKGKDVVGILTSPLTIRFQDGRNWTVKPNYVDKAGTFKGTAFKANGVDLFSIKEGKTEF